MPTDLSPEKLLCRARSNRTGDGTMDWFKIGKGVCQGWILSPCLFNFYAEYSMLNGRLHDLQARIKIARRNINNLRYLNNLNQIGRWYHFSGRKQRGTKEPLFFFVNSNFFIFKIYLFFNWRIIALQNFVGFCQTSTCISHRFICPLPLELPSHLSPHPSRLGCYRAPVWVPWVIQLSLYQSYQSHWLSVLHMVMQLSMLLPPYISPSLSSRPPTMSISLFSMSVSPLLPWVILSVPSF